MRASILTRLNHLKKKKCLSIENWIKQKYFTADYKIIFAKQILKLKRIVPESDHRIIHPFI